MHFFSWLKQYPHWNTVAWLSLIGVGTVLELFGVVEGKLSTFTDLIRQTLPIWVRAIVIGLLIYHFIWQK
jgi:hypothetical protein